MSKTSSVKTIVVPARKIWAAFPAAALICAGVAFAAPVVPAHDILAISSSSSAIVVPDTALTMPAFRAPGWIDAFTGAAPDERELVPADSPALVPPDGAPFGGSTAAALDSTGVPVRALEAYRAAALVVDAADPACHIDWALLAAFGRVESNHARFGGNQLDAAGVAQPGIIGIPLDGTNGTARILDSDGGRLDRDSVYDRAVGPMQFIPSTWRTMGVDADGDGNKNPQDMADSATATAVYVCSGPGDLTRPQDLYAAIMRYNPSSSYARTVTAIAAAYRLGVSALPASDVPAVNPAPSTFFVAQAAPSTFSVATASAIPAPRTLAPQTPTTQMPATQTPTAAPRATQAPTTQAPTTQSPTAPTAVAPSTTVPAAPVTTLPDPCLPVPTATLPTATDPAPTVLTPSDPCLPHPCLPDPAGTLTPTSSPTPVTTSTCTIVPIDPTPTTP